MAIKIGKVMKELNVGRQTIQEFLHTKGITIDDSTNARIEDDVYEMLVKEFEAYRDLKRLANERLKNRANLSGMPYMMEEESALGSFYLIDTNVFIECPDIVSRFPTEPVIILSGKVIDELDYLKLSANENVKSAAQRALKNISQDKDHIIYYEMSVVELLPSDFDKRNADNMIISIAIRYKILGEKVIILSSDKGMQVKANALRVDTISLNDFLAQLDRLPD